MIGILDSTRSALSALDRAFTLLEDKYSKYRPNFSMSFRFLQHISASH